MTTDRLESALGLRFSNQGLLRQALVHRSVLNERCASSLGSYERLEFLGDAVLELVISTELYQRLPQHAEGELTKSRASLVCGESLARIAQRLELGDFLLMGKGEEASGGKHRDSILAAAYEALVAAVYLDQGYDQAREFVLSSFREDLEDFCRRGAPPENPKSLLQEHFQAIGLPSPRYQVLTTQGPDHDPLFTVQVVVDQDVMGTGQGGKKSDAERNAAQDALGRIKG